MWGLATLHRWLRLTPLYAVVLCYWINVARFPVAGPLWHMFDEKNTLAYCRAHWWENLLYATNFHAPNPAVDPRGDKFEAIQTCMGWTWYLTMDMQIYVVAALVLSLYGLGRLRTALVGVLAAVPLFDVVLGGVRSAAVAAPFSMVNPAYMPLYADVVLRAAPFMLGCLAGVYWHYRRAAPAGWRAWACGLGGGALLLANLLLPWTNIPAEGLLVPVGGTSTSPWSQATTNVWNALQRPLYGAGLSLTLLALPACPEWLMRPLQWRGWGVLAKLTYGAYLWHIVVLWSALYGTPDYIYFTFWSTMARWLGVTIGAFVAAALSYVLVEAPCASLQRRLLVPQPKPDTLLVVPAPKPDTLLVDRAQPEP